MRTILYPKDFPSEKLGGKARALAALRHSGILIPRWFVVSSEAFYLSLTETERRRFERATEPATVAPLIQKLEPCCDLSRGLARALRQLCPNGESVAVRSSALEEDGGNHSHAGQLESFLFVRPEGVAEKVAEVWRSAFSERVISYRRARGLNSLPQPPAVLIQRMANAEVSGVAFSADPVTGRRGIAVIGALYGLGSALVSGECNADTYHVDREGRIVLGNIANKRQAHLRDPGSANGLSTGEISAPKATMPALSDEQIQAVARLARKAEQIFGRPQDIEWAMENGRLYLLQSRPITSLTDMPDPEGVLGLWDNSNISESYGGVTTPLTFSFARRAYEEVYRQFCRVMGVRASVIAAHADTFRCMIGLIRGRIYYNLRSWYQVLSLLPGFSVNRRFMEQMMGVKEELPDALLPQKGAASRSQPLVDALRVSLTVSGLIANHFLLNYRIRGFYRRLDLALSAQTTELQNLRADELVAHYHDLERQLLTRWDAPIINDFFAMIFFGVLRRLAQNWCGDQEGNLPNELLCGEGGMVSAEPAKRMREMAQIARRSPVFVGLLTDGALDSILERMENLPEFKNQYQNYLATFGDRCLSELKLESPTLHDDPLPLLRCLAELAKQSPRADEQETRGLDLRRRAEERANGILARRPLRRFLFQWVLRHARARVKERENLRFQRTRLFGRARRIFVEIGKRFYASDILASTRDVFYLELDEILGFVAGTTTTTNLKALVTLRKAEFVAYRAASAPADRFETRGLVHQGNSFERPVVLTQANAKDHRKGIGCSPGVIRGRVRVVIDPSRAAIPRGEILVAERTDPGWVMLFPSAAGVLVERGSLLSHSAVLAREMGIPAIVSVSAVTAWLKDGDWVELDGSSGIVRRVEDPRTENEYAQ